MTRIRAARLDRLSSPTAGWPAVGLLLLAVVGYLAASDLRISTALVAAMALTAWSALAWERPRPALSASFLIVLIAGTKFRVREADASLNAVIDGQILLELGLFGLVGVGVLAAWIARGDRRRLTIVEAIILTYAAIALLSSLWSIAPALTLVRATQLLIVSALAIVTVRVLTPSGALWSACKALAAYVLACAALAPIFPWASETYDLDDGTRWGWFSVHPVAAGTLAALAALGLLSASAFAPPRGTPRMLGIPLFFSAIPVVLVLLLTRSRGPLLAFVASLGTLLLMRLRWTVRIPLILITASFILIYITLGPDLEPWLVSVANQDSAISRVLFRGQTVDTVLQLNGRFGLWDDLRPAIAAHSLIGYGYQASRSVVLDAAAWAAYAHNALLQSVLDLGLLGTLALVVLAIIGLCGGMIGDLSSWMRATVAALMVFLVLNSMSTESFAGAPGFETLLLFVCALCAGSAWSGASSTLGTSPTP